MPVESSVSAGRQLRAQIEVCAKIHPTKNGRGPRGLRLCSGVNSPGYPPSSGMDVSEALMPARVYRRQLPSTFRGNSGDRVTASPSP